jgi:hypothetical protein
MAMSLLRLGPCKRDVHGQLKGADGPSIRLSASPPGAGNAIRQIVPKGANRYTISCPRGRPTVAVKRPFEISRPSLQRLFLLRHYSVRASLVSNLGRLRLLILLPWFFRPVPEEVWITGLPWRQDSPANGRRISDGTGGPAVRDPPITE